MSGFPEFCDNVIWGGFPLSAKGLKAHTWCLTCSSNFQTNQTRVRSQSCLLSKFPSIWGNLKGTWVLLLLSGVFHSCLSDQHQEFLSQDKSVMNSKCPRPCLAASIPTEPQSSCPPTGIWKFTKCCFRITYLWLQHSNLLLTLNFLVLNVTLS